MTETETTGAIVGIDGGDVGLIVHGTTIATNALIEHKGARCGLITTKGFRNVLELGRRDRPRMYGLTGGQRPLIPRDMGGASFDAAHAQ